MAGLTGKVLGNYEVMERLGRGGMADVYKGFHQKLNRYVAIKVLHNYLADGEDFLARFEREARAVANLRHTNIVQVHDFDLLDDQCFMVMELVSGGTLGDWIKYQRPKAALDDVLRIFHQIVSALDYAHTRGIVHRDIKPSNILLDESGQVYLTDFGIARMLSGSQFTATGALIGTPSYMSPEQCKGEEIGPVSDIYSLGVILYEMLTGKQPYDAETPLSILQKHINEAVPLLGELRTDLSDEFDELLAKALAKEPSERYQSAGALLKDLKAAASQHQDVLDETRVMSAAQPTVIETAETVVMLPEEEAESKDPEFQETVVMEEDIQLSEPKQNQEIPQNIEEQKNEAETAQTVVMLEDEAESLDELPVTRVSEAAELPETKISAAPIKSEKVERPKYEVPKPTAKQVDKKAFPWKIVLPIVLLIMVGAVLLLSGIFQSGEPSCADANACRDLGIQAWDGGDQKTAVRYYQQAIELIDGPLPDFAHIWCEYTELSWQLDNGDQYKYVTNCFMAARGGDGCYSVEECADWGHHAMDEQAYWEAANFFEMAAGYVPDVEHNEFAFLWCERARAFEETGENELAQQSDTVCQEWAEE